MGCVCGGLCRGGGDSTGACSPASGTEHLPAAEACSLLARPSSWRGNVTAGSSGAAAAAKVACAGGGGGGCSAVACACKNGEGRRAGDGCDTDGNGDGAGGRAGDCIANGAAAAATTGVAGRLGRGG